MFSVAFVCHSVQRSPPPLQGPGPPPHDAETPQPCSICSPYCRQAGGLLQLRCRYTLSKNLWLDSCYLCTRKSSDIPLLFNAIIYAFETLMDLRSSPELVVLYLLINTVYCLYFRTKELRLTVTVRGFTRPGMKIWWALRRKRRPNWRTTPQGDVLDAVVLSMYSDHNKQFRRLGCQFDRFMLSPEVFTWLQLKFCVLIFRITVDKYRGITFDTTWDNEFRYTWK